MMAGLNSVGDGSPWEALARTARSVMGHLRQITLASEQNVNREVHAETSNKEAWWPRGNEGVCPWANSNTTLKEEYLRNI